MQTSATRLLENIIREELKFIKEAPATGSYDYFKNNPDALIDPNPQVKDRYAGMDAKRAQDLKYAMMPKGNWYDTPEGIANHILNASAKYRSSKKTLGSVTEWDDYEAHVVDAFSRIPDYSTMSKVNNIIIKKSGKNFVNFLNSFMSGPEFVDKMGGQSIVNSIERIYGDKAYDSVIKYLKKPGNFDFKDYLKSGWETYKKGAEYRMDYGRSSLVELATEWYKKHNTWNSFINAEDGLRDILYSEAGLVGSAMLSVIPLTKIPVAIAFGLLAADDIYRISKGQDIPGVYLELIVDLLGVFVGGTGKLLSKAVMGILKPVLNLLFKYAGKFTGPIVLKLVNMLKKVPKATLKLLDKMLSGLSALFAKINSSLNWITKTLSNLIKEYPLLKAVIQPIIGSISRIAKIVKSATSSVVGGIGWTLNLLLQLVKFVLTPGKQVTKLLEKFGVISPGGTAGKVVQTGVATTAVVMSAPYVMELLNVYEPTQTEIAFVEQIVKTNEVEMSTVTKLQVGDTKQPLKEGDVVYAIKPGVKTIDFYYSEDLDSYDTIDISNVKTMYQTSFTEDPDDMLAQDYGLIALRMNRDPDSTTDMPDYWFDIVWLTEPENVSSATLILPD
jgi:hypothetical protein